MVHNGIEYADMQLIAESYDLLYRGLGCSAEELESTFSHWNRSHLNSYLIEITSKIFGKKDVDGAPLVDKILDVAGQKGTGKWTVASALDLSVPLSLVGEAVFTRYLSARIEDRQKVGESIGDEVKRLKITKNSFYKRLEKALYAAKIISYAQGFYLMHEASSQYGWDLNLGACALMWRGGCIIRSAFLGKIKEAYDRDPELSLLILDPFFKKALSRSIDSLRRVVVSGALNGIPLPCFSAALSWYDGIRSRRLPTNLLQAQRDLFGAHTFERIDKPRGEMFHADWLIGE
jgi:6-phosphogluconate dehydrogenase